MRRHWLQDIPCIEGLHNFGAVGVFRATRDSSLNGLIGQGNKNLSKDKERKALL